MARIPDEEIQRLKREVSLERLVVASGVELKRHGADLVGLCPFHDDRGPSLVISPRKNLWHCLGACQEGGSVIDWVMKSRGLSFRHAVEVLRGDPPSLEAPKRALLPSPVERDADDREVLRQVVAYYHETLKQSREALAYLEERGLRSAEAIERFQLGFANRTLGYRLASRGARERLQRLGLLRDSGHEHFNGSLVIPILSETGEVLGMYGRKVTPSHKLRKGTPLHLYLPGPHRGVFNVSALQASRTVIVCEALIDALTFWCSGYRNVTASYGVEGFTEDHLEAFARYGTRTVLIAYDRDEAGERAAVALSEKLMARGIECYRVQFPKGMDANAYACKVKPAEKSLGVLVRHAVWLGKGRAPARVLDSDLVAIGAESGVSEAATASPGEGGQPDPVTPAAAGTSAALPQASESTSSEAVSPAIEATPSLSLAALAAKEETHGGLVEASASEVALAFGERRYRVRGLDKNLSHGQLKVNLLVSKGEALHVDTLDLYSARQRTAFLKQAAAELGISEDTLKRELGRVLLRLEELQDERIRETLTPKPRAKELSDSERARALGLLQDPQLLERILCDFEACGIVGEETNKLLGYLAAVSRKLDEPLAVIVQSSSAAGKTSLMEAVLSFVPEEDRVKYSAMTGQSLFYMGETDLQHKVLAIVEEQGVERASYALKLLQSEGELTIASTGKDPQTGRLVTQEYRVKGPVMIFLTTTAVEIDEELLNRCLVLSVDEDREQTRRVHRLQRERQTLEGLLARQSRPEILKLHQDAQRLLRPLLVANPYARQLTFMDDRTRTRRDHVKYLTLIRVVALLHQYQREIKTVLHGGVAVPYIEVTKADIALANRLAHQVLGRSLDELSPQTRRVLMALERMVEKACAEQELSRQEYRFSRKDVRERTGLSDFQARTHLDKLVSLEYVLVHRGGRGQSFVYELLYDGRGKDGQPFLSGLLDAETLGYDGKIEHRDAHIEGGSSPDRGPIEPLPSTGRDPLPPISGATDPSLAAKAGKNAHLEAGLLPSRRSHGGNGSAAQPGY
jgi:DNA primase